MQLYLKDSTCNHIKPAVQYICVILLKKEIIKIFLSIFMKRENILQMNFRKMISFICKIKTKYFRIIVITKFKKHPQIYRGKKLSNTCD